VLAGIRALPQPALRLLSGAVARLAVLLRIRWRVAVDNVTSAFPEKARAECLAIAKAAYRSLALAVIESLTSDLKSNAEIESAVSTVDWKGLDERLTQQLPTLVVSAHLGSWEFFAEVMARRGIRFSAVVRPLRGALNDWVVRNRLKAGVELILQRGALKGMLRAISQNKTVVQLIDQSLPARHGVFVDFFGRPASTTPAVSLVALRTKAPVYVVVAVRENGALRMHVEGPVPLPVSGTRDEQVRAHTQALTRIIETYIKAYPQQWLWLHRRWKETPLLP
jgi:Kdo2-lipid IVA lauroyltransferase/acyltransferase